MKPSLGPPDFERILGLVRTSNELGVHFRLELSRVFLTSEYRDDRSSRLSTVAVEARPSRKIFHRSLVFRTVTAWGESNEYRVEDNCKGALSMRSSPAINVAESNSRRTYPKIA